MEQDWHSLRTSNVNFSYKQLSICIIKKKESFEEMKGDQLKKCYNNNNNYGNNNDADDILT